MCMSVFSWKMEVSLLNPSLLSSDQKTSEFWNIYAYNILDYEDVYSAEKTGKQGSHEFTQISNLI